MSAIEGADQNDPGNDPPKRPPNSKSNGYYRGLKNAARYGPWVLDRGSENNNRHLCKMMVAMEDLQMDRFPRVNWNYGDEGWVGLPVLLPMDEEGPRDLTRETVGLLDLFNVILRLNIRCSHMSAVQVCEDSELEADPFPDEPVPGDIVYFRDREGKVAFQVEWVENYYGEARWKVLLDMQGHQY